MLPKAQLNSLKEGDSVIIHGTFAGKTHLGNIIIQCKRQDASGISAQTFIYVHPSAVSLHSEHGTLVTPVEALEPYSIDPANTNVLYKHGKKFATFENDDAAEEMCDRLNAEWRKEQNND